MTAKPALLGVFAWSLLAIPYSRAVGQAADSSVTQWSEEVDAHVQFASQWRVLSYVGGVQQNSQNYPFQQWYAAAGLGYQFKPISTPHTKNIDPDKEFYFLFGAGYTHLDTTSSGKIENRATIDATVGYMFPGDLLVRDRNWLELRWVNGNYSTTYRNLLMLEHEFRIHGLRVSPFGSVEAFYDGVSHTAEQSYGGAKGSWNQWWYTVGAQLPYERQFAVQVLYRRKSCSTCAPENFNEWAISLHFFFDFTPSAVVQ
jgi:hypothetical protein